MPDSGNDGPGVEGTPANGVDVAQIQLVAFRQEGFLQIPFEQTIELVQSVLLLQESPQERGGTGVAVGAGVADPEGFAVGLPVGLSLGEAVGLPLGEEVAVAVGELT